MQVLELKTNSDKVLRALQEIQLEGLKELDRICRKHNIKYSLGGGTSLGQVRHGGFIPWDDDIDIDMTAENYNKFIKVAMEELDTNRFFLRCRETDKTHLRTQSRLEIKFTKLGTTYWDKKKISAGLFIDIFKLSYLPNNKFLRKIVSSTLFYIRCAENYKMFHRIAKKSKHKLLVVLMGKFIPKKILFYIEDKLTTCCGDKKTDWLLDDAIINGNYGGMSSKGVDSYEDVTFEGVKIMDKKDPHNFLLSLYGKNYMKWLPPASRISHHRWTQLDFGIYAPKYDLPKDYEKYLTIKYLPDNLKRMQEVSLEMINDIHQICKKYNLKYFVSNINAYIKLQDVDEFGKMFREPLKIAMPRKDYEKFSKIAQNELENKYFYQTNETDPEYKCSFARLRLNYTYIRDNSIPKRIEDKFNSGFFVSIIPLDNTANDIKKRQRHAKKIRYLNHFISLKWKHYNVRYFIRKSLKTKVKMLMLLPFPLKSLMKKLERVSKKYNDTNTDYYIDSTGYQLDYRTIEKNILGCGQILQYNGYDIIFPINGKEYIEYIDSVKNKQIYDNIKSLNYVKNNYNNSYLEMAQNISENEIKKIQKKFNSCFLTYYDIPEYQLSVLRYDEKRKKYLTNEEIINYQKNVHEVWQR